jgi:putative NADH-flavin reductase
MVSAMKIALIGASGFVGSRLLAEGLQRGHHVTALVRHPENIETQQHLKVLESDVLNVDELAKQLAGHDVVISAFNPARQSLDPDIYERHVAGHKAIIAAVKKSGVRRLLAVGGAASLKTAAGIEFLDSPEFPADYEPYKPSIRGTRALYYLLKEERELDWVFLAPSVRTTPGARTGSYRVGKDHVLYDAQGASHISLEDYAVAMLDELEKPKHHRERFTVGY